MRGARWRIYFLSQGVNWTSTTCLGSHLIKAPSRLTPSGSGFPSPWVWFLVGLGFAGAIAFLRWRTLRSRRDPTPGGASSKASSPPGQPEEESRDPMTERAAGT